MVSVPAFFETRDKTHSKRGEFSLDNLSLLIYNTVNKITVDFIVLT